MDITYLGHSCFKLKSTGATVVTDPYENSLGFNLPSVSADVVTVSHDHGDHNNIKAVSRTARRDRPFVIDEIGEYEILGVSVFGVASYHDDEEGAKRGKNRIFSILIDGVSVVHLGDLGHQLSDKQVEQINGVDVLLVPVGGVYTIDPAGAAKVVADLEPAMVVPMHYKTDKHNPEAFGGLAGVDEFLKEMGVGNVERTDKLSVSRVSLPEETKVVVLES